MTPSHAPPITLEERITQVAAGLATEKGSATRAGDGARQYLVRMSATLADLIESGKPADLPMATFLRQCGVRVALEHMERTQGT